MPKILKNGGFCDMIQIVKKKIKMNEELRSKIKWACIFRNCEPMIKERKITNSGEYKFSLCRATSSHYKG